MSSQVAALHGSSGQKAKGARIIVATIETAARLVDGMLRAHGQHRARALQHAQQQAQEQAAAADASASRGVAAGASEPRSNVAVAQRRPFRENDAPLPLCCLVVDEIHSLGEVLCGR